MADSLLTSTPKHKRNKGRYCVAGYKNKESCRNTSYTNGITMYQFPSDPETRTKWTKFVQKHRPDFKAPPERKNIALCSAHFKEECFSKPRLSLVGMENIKFRKILLKGSVPTEDVFDDKDEGNMSARDQRHLRRSVLIDNFGAVPVPNKKRRCEQVAVDNVENTRGVCVVGVERDIDSADVGTGENSCVYEVNVETNSSLAAVGVEEVNSSSVAQLKRDSVLSVVGVDDGSQSVVDEEDYEGIIESEDHGFGEHVGFVSVGGAKKRKTTNYQMKCKNLGRANRRMKSQVSKLKAEIKTLKKQLSYNEAEVSGDDNSNDTIDATVDLNSTTADLHAKSDENSAYYVWSTEGSEDEGEHHKEKEEWTANTESAESSEETENDMAKESWDKDVKVDPATPLNKEPKFIVFYGMLAALFNLFCFNCKSGKPKVTMKTNGTMVTVYQECNHCINGFTWRSQPYIFGRYPAGNILLSFGTILAGASISKVMLIFRHMGLCAYSPRTFFRHQRMFIFPSILKYWEIYRNSLINLAKQTKDVIWCGDGRFDSMGHCAKYGVYTLMSTTLMKIVHFEVVQSNETNGANQTELEGVKRCFKFMEQAGVPVKTFISDRHRGIAKWIRETTSQTVHYFDIWHVARSLWKKLLKASKEGGCEKITSWMKGIRRHLYWSATSTKPGFGALIVAKWSSFLRHVANIHNDHPNDLYKKCNHEPLQERLWIKRGTAAHDKLKNLMLNKTLLNDVAKLSPDAQTSSLEGFHATLNHWHPKMIGFSFLGTCCRHILASLHFNENVKRTCRSTKDGKKYYRVTYPKFKLGEEAVKEVPVPPTYEYADGICQVLFALPFEELKFVFQKYSANVPEPLNRQFPDRKCKEDAVKDYEARKKNSTPLFPSVSDQDTMLQKVSEAQTSTSRPASVRRCGKCKMPGHNRRSCNITISS